MQETRKEDVCSRLKNAYSLNKSVLFFSRLAAAKKANVKNPDNLNEDEVQDLESDLQAEAHESELNLFQQNVLKEITEKHPSYFDRYN